MTLKVLNVLFFFSILLSTQIFSQKSTTDYFRIDLGNKYSNSQLEKALLECNLVPYLMETREVPLQFDDGAVVTLFPARTLTGKGFDINMNRINSSQPPNRNTFSLSASGHIIERIRKMTKEEIGVLLKENR